MQEFDGLKILEVKRPGEPCPAPNELIIEWIDGNWKILSVKTIQHKEVIAKEILKEDGTDSQIEEYFIDEGKHKILFEEWTDKRNNRDSKRART